MVLLLDPVARESRSPVASRAGAWVVPALTALTVLVRLPFVALPAGADEAGFLQVGAQWATGSGSLYGSYWVDRPPLLVTLYGLAAALGGVLPLRVLGAVAAALVVLLVAWAAGQVAGPRAARWSATAAAALLVSPLAGALEVNGELLAAPFVALGIGAAIAAVRAEETTPVLAWSAVAGAAGVCALLVKQNIVDVAVFGVALLALGALGGRASRRTTVRIVAGAAGGAALASIVLALWTLAHGTSLVGVFDATYPFRIRAGRVLAEGGQRYAQVRLGHLSAAWLGSGLCVLTVVLLVAVARRRLRDPVLAALAVTAAFDLVSIALGGGYWLHYLVEAAVPLAVAVGPVVATSGTRLTGALPRAAVAVTVLAAVGGLGVVAVHPPPSAGEQVGAAIGQVARPGDTLTTLYGEAQVNLASGLPSPYPYLWSLPIRTLDPRLTALDAVLSGPHAPTWLVVGHRVAGWGLDTAATQDLLDARYRTVATIQGQSVMLLDGVDRATPTTRTDQEQP